MDYDQLGTPELQQECKRRGLPSGRVKADLVQRLTDHDASGAETPPAGEQPALIQCTFPAGSEGPDDEEHLAYRQTTIQTAIEQGLAPHGDAYRVGTVDGHEVYEVNVRAVT